MTSQWFWFVSQYLKSKMKPTLMMEDSSSDEDDKSSSDDAKDDDEKVNAEDNNSTEYKNEESQSQVYVSFLRMWSVVILVWWIMPTTHTKDSHAIWLGLINLKQFVNVCWVNRIRFDRLSGGRFRSRQSWYFRMIGYSNDKSLVCALKAPITSRPIIFGLTN